MTASTGDLVVLRMEMQKEIDQLRNTVKDLRERIARLEIILVTGREPEE